jgi:hypothetical protein
MGLTSIFVTSLVSSLQGRRAAHDASVRAQELAHAAAVKGRVLTQDGKVKVTDLSSKGKQTTVDLLAQAKDTASHMSGTAAENIRQLPQIGAHTINETRGIMNSALGDAKGYINTVSSNKINENSNGSRLVTGGAANEMSHILDSTGETEKQMVPGVNVSEQPGANHLQNAVSSLSAQIGGEESDLVADTGF